MRKLGLALLSVISAAAWSADAERIPGVWAVPANEPLYYVALSTQVPSEGGLQLDGIITETLAGAPQSCTRCRGDWRGQPLVGMTLLADVYNEGAAWAGTLLDPITGREWQAKFIISLDEQLLTVTKTNTRLGATVEQVWQRVE